MQRYFLNETYEVAKEHGFSLIGEDYHHAVHVMRMEVGDCCYLAFQDKQAIVGEITHVTAEKAELKEVQKENQEKELPVEVTIACGYPKGDKLEWIIQKGTELGACQFIGFPSQTSVVKWDQKKLQKKQQRFEKIAKEAAEQSHRTLQPTVQLLLATTELYQQINEFDHCLIAYEESAKQGETKQLVKTLQEIQPTESLLLIFGPEGGFHPSEIEKLEQLGAKRCGLGPRILRAETAPLYALSTISYQLELM